MQWTGARLVLFEAVNTSTPLRFNQLNSTLSQGYLKNTNNNFPNLGLHNRLGYLESSADITKTPIDVTNVGHVFGRYGQGEATMPSKNYPFLWAEQKQTYKPGMLVSLFPETITDVGLNSALKSIQIDAMALPFTNLNSLTTPATPEKPMALQDLGGAYLAASMVWIASFFIC